MLSLVLDDIYDDPSWNSASNILDVVRQTFDILSQALPDQLDREMPLDLTENLINASKGPFESIL